MKVAESDKTMSNSELLIHLKRHKFPYIILAVLLIYSIPILRDLISDWARDGNYSHGFLIIPISLWLFHRKRKELVFPAPPSTWGMVLFALGCLGLIFGMAASEYFSIRVSLVLALSGLGLHYLGSANFRKVWFSFFFLLFMIPIPAIIYYASTLPMQLFASNVTGHVLQFIGVPSQRQGNLIFLPAYTLEVSEACSGLRSLATLLALGALFGYLALPGRAKPAILFLAAIPIAIIVNIIRLVFTAVGAYAISTKLAESFLHELSGIIVFFIALLLMSLLVMVLKWERNRS